MGREDGQTTIAATPFRPDDPAWAGAVWEGEEMSVVASWVHGLSGVGAAREGVSRRGRGVGRARERLVSGLDGCVRAGMAGRLVGAGPGLVESVEAVVVVFVGAEPAAVLVGVVDAVWEGGVGSSGSAARGLR